MGRVTNQITGTARGKVGNLIYRAKKIGESTVYPHNPNRKKPDTPLAIAHNNRFKTINKFSSAVNESAFLKGIWKTYRNIKGKSAYNKIHSFNYCYSYPDFMEKGARILPGGINCKITGFAHKDDYFTIKFMPTNELLENLKPPFLAIIMIYLNSPASKRKGRLVLDHNKYLTFETEIQTNNLVLGKPAKIKSKHYENAFKIIDDYKRVRVFLSLVFNSQTGKRMWSYSTSYLYKGAELDFLHDEMIQKRFDERQKKLKEPKGKYSELRLR
jgi:hypothetical protein